MMLLAACSANGATVPSPTPGREAPSPSGTPETVPSPGESPSPSAEPTPSVAVGPPPSGNPETSPSGYPWHTDIVATTFWVGEIFDPNASDGSQVISTYNSTWMEDYGGCDGTTASGVCETEARSPANDYFPTSTIPKENPFYLDLPFDDVNDPAAFARRDTVVPWAGEPGYAEYAGDNHYSYMKNRWVMLRREGRVCYGQVQDAGPAEYNDAEYVFGTDDRRPKNTKYNGAGMDVSPALNSCLGFNDLNGDSDRLDWAFVEEADVPDGPWTKVITTSQVR